MAEVLKVLSQKRKSAIEFDQNQFIFKDETVKKSCLREMELEMEIAGALATSVPVIVKGNRSDRSQDERRDGNWWTMGYQNWDEEAFKRRLRVSRDTFEFILSEIRHDILKNPTRMKPHPTLPETQLALCLYRLAHGCTFLNLGDLFDVAESTAHVIFQVVCKAIVDHLYDRLVHLPQNAAEWNQELQGFLENWEFPCVGAWDGLHVYVTTQLKNFYSYKKRYSVTNMGFVGYNKRFMWAAVGAPGSTHDSRLLRSCQLFHEIESGCVLPNRVLNIQPHGEIPFTTVGDSAFPILHWLLKPYREGTRDPRQRHFNKRLCSARVVSEHAYGMLKGRWRILYKKTECSLDNISLVIMTCIALHNLCIHRKDPCNPRWRLQVNNLNLIRGNADADASTNRDNVAQWLWDIKEARDAAP